MKSRNVKKSFSIIWEQHRKRPWLVVAMVVTALLVSVAYIIEPYILKLLVDTLSSKGGRHDLYQQAVSIVGLLAILYVIENVVFYLGARALVAAEIDMIYGLHQKAYNYIQDHSINFFADNFSGSIVKKMTRAIDSAEQMVDTIWFTFLPVTARLSFMFIVLVFYSPSMALVLFLGVGIFVGYTLVILQYWLPKERRVVRAESRLSGKLVDSISNNITIKTFSRERNESADIARAALSLKKAHNKSWVYFWMHINFPQSFIWITMLLTALMVSLYLWSIGMYSLGDIIFIQTYLFTLGPILWESVNRFQEFKQNSVKMSELHELLDAHHDIVDVHDARTLSVGGGEVEFTDVRFAYSGLEVFSGLSFKIQPAEKIAFVGHSGSGKSTIVKLLFRFYDIQHGTITIDGKNIAAVTQESLRHQISMVPQDPILFHRTIRENLAYGNPKATDKEIEIAAKKAHAHEFIQRLPKGYDTMVGERGVKLSGGERQRVAIARAFLENAPIIVFDEATSSLDSISEKYIQDALDELMKERTVIVIAHRLSTIVKMDRILVFDNGDIVEQGTHGALLDEAGLYSELWRMQTDTV